MTATWLTGNALAFDLETTGPDPESARIVSAHAVEVGPKGAEVKGSWLVNPGVPIPPEATAVHGITDAMAATGLAPGVAAGQIRGVLADAWFRGLAVIVMNAPFDLTVLARECVRHHLTPQPVGHVIDPLVIDRGLDPYRKGKRTLAALAEFYGVKQGAAHSADGDALTAARIVWRMSSRYWPIQNKTISELQTWQANEHLRWAVHYSDYLRGKGEEPSISTEWPIQRIATRSAA